MTEDKTNIHANEQTKIARFMLLFNQEAKAGIDPLRALDIVVKAVWVKI